MIPNLLPPTLHSSTPRPMSATGGWGHAQSLSAQKIGEGHRQAAAGVSVSQVMRNRAGSRGAASSIHHLSTEGNNTTAINRGAQKQASTSVYNQAPEDDGLEDKRYEYMRSLILKKKAVERIRQERMIQQRFHGDAGKKPEAFMKKMVHTYNPKKLLGERYDADTRKDMKKDIKSGVSSGQIGRGTAEEMKKLVDRLK